MTIEGLFYLDGKPVVIDIENDKISSVKRSDSKKNDLYIAPGFIDNQINGYVSVDFARSDLTVQDVVKATKALWRVGVTTYMPTVITSSEDVMLKSCAALALAMQDDEIGPSIAGIHLEGPYISPEDGYRGAHNAQWVRQPDWDELQRINEAAKGAVRQVTLAPEWDGAVEFIEKCTRAGIVAALGHHNGSTDQIRAALDAGARIATHLGNGLANVIDRHDNPLWPQLADDRLTASMIVDGFHLTPEEVTVFYKVKGIDRIILTSDITLLAGMPPGKYVWDGKDIELSPEGLITLPSQNVLAGASLPLPVGIGNMMRFTGCSLAEAVHTAGRNQARLFAMHDRGELLPGKRADIVMFTMEEGRLHIRKTLVNGRIVYSHDN